MCVVDRHGRVICGSLCPDWTDVMGTRSCEAALCIQTVVAAT
jgi:hypothetical protein